MSLSSQINIFQNINIYSKSVSGVLFQILLRIIYTYLVKFLYLRLNQFTIGIDCRGVQNRIKLNFRK